MLKLLFAAVMAPLMVLWLLAVLGPLVGVPAVLVIAAVAWAVWMAAPPRR